MARIASIAKLGYYPTPAGIVDKIADRFANIRFPGKEIVVVDPCCGEGTALAKFSARIGEIRGKSVIPLGVEADEGRALEAKRNCAIKAQAGAIEDVVTSGREPEILFLNPPYDESGQGERAELDFLRIVSTWDPLTVMFIVTDRFEPGGDLHEKFLKTVGSTSFEIIEYMRFPEPEFARFRQTCILLAKTHDGIEPVRGVLGKAEPCGDVWLSTRHPQYMPHFSVAVTDLPRVEPTPVESLARLFGAEGSSSSLSPLLPLRSEHAALVAAAGLFNGTLIDGKVIKGSVEKHIHLETSTETDSDGCAVAVEIRRECHSTRITTFDPGTGEMETISANTDPDRFTKYLLENAKTFAEKARETNPHFCTAEKLSSIDLSFARAPRALPGRAATLLPKQEEAAKAVVAAWERSKAAIVVGEMSTGKTTISLAAAGHLARTRNPWNRKIVVLCPAKKDLANKWLSEARAVLATANGGKAPETVEVESIREVDRVFKREGLVVIAIRETQAKASSSWKNVRPNLKKAQGFHHVNAAGERVLSACFEPKCPNCGKSVDLLHPSSRKQVCDHLYDHCPACGAERHGKRKSCMDCGTSLVCGEILWSMTAGGKKPRYPIAKHIARRYRGSYVLIMDECHGYKNSASNRGQASTSLVSAAHRVLMLTGTIYGGYASSIFHLLHRTSPEFQKAFSHTEVGRFVDMYGLLEKTKKTYGASAKRHNYSGYNEVKETVKELPGTHPGMCTWLLGNTAFIQLRDLEIAMPPYSEHTLFVEPTPELERAYTTYIEDLKEAAIKLKAEGDSGPLAEWNWARYGVLDRPREPEEIAGVQYVPPCDDGSPFPKEEALIRLVLKEKGEGRKCLVYLQQMIRRDPSPKLVELMERYGIRAAVMRPNVEERVEWIRKRIAEGADVILTSAALVSEGVDIVECPTIIWAGHEWNMYCMPQASRRSYRLNQTLPVRVYYLAYNRTAQATAMARIAMKLKAQQSLQGDVANGLAVLKAEQQFHDMLTSAVSDKEHHESDISLDSLPSLPSGEETKSKTKEPVMEPVVKQEPKPAILFQPDLFSFGEEVAS